MRTREGDLSRGGTRLASHDDVVIRAEDLSFRYRSARPEAPPALEDISFHVRRGEVFGILGPNGAGKTTLIKMISTILLPQAGRLDVLGHALPAGEQQVRLRLGVCLAESERAFAWRLTGRQNLAYAAAFFRLDRREAERRIDELLAMLGLREHADKLFQEYSTGLKHRLALARALLPRPDLLVLDEPTAGLDVRSSHELAETLRRLAAGGVTIVYTTHRLEEAAALCDRVLVVREGRLAAVAAPTELARLVQQARVVEVALEGVVPASYAELPGRGTVSRAELTGRSSLRLQCGDVDAALGEVLAWARAERVGIASVASTGPTLVDAFVAITEGRLQTLPAGPPARPRVEFTLVEARR
ncbi:MAG: type transport system ATP-binding protein [Thermoplasmata archaeon]|jgi:ABC-2 type transport system ATP-binding protein|nr:type transport system ATP-binding protein [Thermoplasmata archaeon]